MTCVSGACTGVCAPGQVQCYSNSPGELQTCNSSGQWGTPVPCAAPSNLCSYAECQPPCSPAGSQRCTMIDNGSPVAVVGVEICQSDGVWDFIAKSPSGYCQNTTYAYCSGIGPQQSGCFNGPDSTGYYCSCYGPTHTWSCNACASACNSTFSACCTGTGLPCYDSSDCCNGTCSGRICN